jgi:hypothetical protein
VLSSLLFVGLNVADAYLTRVAIGTGFATEGNMSLVAQAFGSNMLAKALLSVLAVLVMNRIGNSWSLWLANLGMFGVVFWNAAVCFAMSMPGAAWRIVIPF